MILLPQFSLKKTLNSCENDKFLAKQTIWLNKKHSRAIDKFHFLKPEFWINDKIREENKNDCENIHKIIIMNVEKVLSKITKEYQ